MTDESRWVRQCWGCGRYTDDWAIMTPLFSGIPTVPLCQQCAQRERDHRKEKAE